MLKTRVSKLGVRYATFRQVNIRSKNYPESNMRQIPDTDWFLSQYCTLGDIAASLPDFLGTYDFAIPQSEFTTGMRGVWSYKHSRIFGAFVSLDDMLVELGRLINESEEEVRE